jgi:hypothetical protein
MQVESVILGFFIGGVFGTLCELVILGRVEAATKRAGNSTPQLRNSKVDVSVAESVKRRMLRPASSSARDEERRDSPE